MKRIKCLGHVTGVAVFLLILLLSIPLDLCSQHIETRDGVRYIQNEKEGLWKDHPKVELNFVGLLSEMASDNGSEVFFNKPRDIAQSTTGNYFILEAGNCIIREFDSDFKLLGSFGGSGQGPGEFVSPGAIDIAPSGDIYISDNMTSKLNIYTAEGAFKKVVSIKGHENYFSLAPDGTVFMINPTVGYAAGSKKFSLIHQMDEDGQIINRIGDGVIYTEFPLSNGGNRFRFDMDAEGNICIVFLFQNRIEKYSMDGELIFSMKRVIPKEMIINKKLETYYSLTTGVSFDDQGRIWNLERLERSYRFKKEDLESAWTEMNGAMVIDKSKLAELLPEKTHEFAIDLYSSDGLFLQRFPLDHYCSNLRICGDLLFVFDQGVSMDVYVYRIVE